MNNTKLHIICIVSVALCGCSPKEIADNSGAPQLSPAPQHTVAMSSAPATKTLTTHEREIVIMAVRTIPPIITTYEFGETFTSTNDLCNQRINNNYPKLGDAIRRMVELDKDRFKDLPRDVYPHFLNYLHAEEDMATYIDQLIEYKLNNQSMSTVIEEFLRSTQGDFSGLPAELLAEGRRLKNAFYEVHEKIVSARQEVENAALEYGITPSTQQDSTQSNVFIIR